MDNTYHEMAMNRILEILDSPYMSLVRGGILVFTAFFEAVETGIEKLIGVDIGLIHGFFALGFVEVVRSIPDIIEGARNVQSGGEGKRSTD